MGFEFLGFKIQRGKGRFKLTRDRIKSTLNRQDLYAIPTQKSVNRFKDQIRDLTKRHVPLRMGELIKTINPIIRGWGNYYCRSHVRKRFNQLDRLDRPKALVASRQAMAEHRLEGLSQRKGCARSSSWSALSH